MTFKMNYDDEAARQEIVPAPVGNAVAQPVTRRRWQVPSIVKTAATFAICGALFFADEAFGPDWSKPSTLLGTVESRVGAQVKAAELTQQGKYDAWAAQLRVRAEQQSNRYNTASQAILNEYQGSMQRMQIYAQGLVNLQNQYVAARIGQTQSEQGTDVAMENYARLFGRVFNLLEPGSGDKALAYSHDLHNQLGTELNDAAQNGQRITVDGWDAGLPSVAEVHRQLEQLRPMDVPPPPRLGVDVPTTR